MNTATPLAGALLALAALSPAHAGKLGEHPAVIVARLHAAQGYDYAAQFYPHPAKLYLWLDAPREGDRPADIALTDAAKENAGVAATQTASIAVRRRRSAR